MGRHLSCLTAECTLSLSLSLLLYHRQRRLDIKATTAACDGGGDAACAFAWLPNLAEQAKEQFCSLRLHSQTHTHTQRKREKEKDMQTRL